MTVPKVQRHSSYSDLQPFQKTVSIQYDSVVIATRNRVCTQYLKALILLFAYTIFTLSDGGSQLVMQQFKEYYSSAPAISVHFCELRVLTGYNPELYRSNRSNISSMSPKALFESATTGASKTLSVFSELVLSNSVLLTAGVLALGKY